VPFFAITIFIENFYMIKKYPERIKLKDSFTSIGMGLGSVVIDTFFTKFIILSIYTFFYQFSLFKIDPSPIAWIVLLFLEDFCYYWFHRIGHESRFFWASHVIHHSSESYNLSTAVRQTWTGSVINTLFWIPLILLGFSPLMVMIQQSISLIYQFWIHTETIGQMGFLEKILNTPSHHRVHHGSDLKYLDKNYAGIFIIWDKLFGSFQKEEETPNYGLVKNINTYNPIKIAYGEWYHILKDVIHSKSISQAFGHIFKPPAWSPQGGTTTAELQRSLKN
jgi:sterol desaturase/sphingolipid hydroxylase (fatty acid hydroxylase superfamily)